MLLKTSKVFANVTASSTGWVLVNTSPAFMTKVVGFILSCGGTATTVTFNSASTAISATFNLGANTQLVALPVEDGWFTTAKGQNLTVTTGAGSTVGVQVIYITDIAP